MDEMLQKIADALEDSGRFDSVSYDGDGLILVCEDDVYVSLTGAELSADEDDRNGANEFVAAAQAAADQHDPLLGMTQEKWNALTPKGRRDIVDVSGYHPKLVDHIGKKVRVTPPRGEDRLSTFIVGNTTGWRPVLMAMKPHGRETGSSDLIYSNEVFDTVEVLS